MKIIINNTVGNPTIRSLFPKIKSYKIEVRMFSSKRNSRKRTKGVHLNKKSRFQYENAKIIKAPITFNIVLNQIGSKIGYNCDEAINEVITFHDEMIQNHSVVEGTARFNMIRLYSIKLLEGQNPDPLTRVAVGKKDRWPSGFNLLRPLYYRVRDHKCSISDRIIRSILYLNRLCDGNGVPDFKEIEKPFDVSKDFISRYSNFIKDKVPTASFELITKPSTRVTSKGPNGRPKWLTADLEAYALTRSMLHESFKELCQATGNNDLYEYMQARASTLTRVDRQRLRYITTVRDQGNKCRLVAISDYWTQVLLEPIMRDVQEFIKLRFKHVSYSTDHAMGYENLKRYIKPGVKCYDVSSWTDAFPAVLQKEFMTARYGSHIAQCWYKLVVECEWSIKNSKTPMIYRRGQGMGTNGSFDIATATDLLLLEMIYTEDYKMSITADTFNKVGDDLWCFDPNNIVLNTYVNECGIDINLSKTKEATKENLCGEFVSRNINHGVDVSRISANICRAVKRNPLDLPQLSHHLEERGYESVIPIKEILQSNKIGKDLQQVLVRTYVTLSLLYPERGLDGLRYSVEQNMPEFYYSDEYIQLITSNDIRPLRDTYNMFSIKQLLDSITEKQGLIFDAATEFDSSDILMQRAEPSMIWDVHEPIGLLTSKNMMAKSFGAMNELYRAGTFNNTDDVLSALERTDQGMTFKELGVISTTGVVWRPKATRLFNLVKTIVVRDLDDTTHSLLTMRSSSELASMLCTSIELPTRDPIFTGVTWEVIGQCETVPAI